MRRVAITALFLAACADAPPDLSITDVTLNPPLGGRTVGAAYMTISNAGGATELVAATSSEADVIELHKSSRVDGIARMEKLDRVPIPSGDTVLEQGGLHLMVFGLSAEEAADGVPLVLEFADGTTLETVAN